MKTVDVVLLLVVVLVFGYWFAALFLTGTGRGSRLDPEVKRNPKLPTLPTMSHPVRGQRRRGAYRAMTSWIAPPLIAVVLALVSLPLIAQTLGIFDTTHLGFWGDAPPPLDEGDPRRLTTAAGAVLSAALVAGLLGGPLVRRNRTWGGVFTFVLASVVAVIFWPVVPSLLHQHVGEVASCIGACQPVVDSDDVLSGLRAVPYFALAFLYEPVAVGSLAVGVAAWASVVRRLLGAVEE